jgi:radical SAM superfamily enzyme YgiQ (UPF0313 family)
VRKFKDIVARLHDAGIGIIGAFMFGFDGEDDSVFERTAEFADKARIDVPQYSILTPLPGTPLYTQMEHTSCSLLAAPRRRDLQTVSSRR